MKSNTALSNYFKELDSNRLSALNTKALILNRLGKYQESLDLDKEILSQAKLNHQSIARSIHNNIRLNNLKSANIFANQLRTGFGKDIVDKYSEYFLILENKNKESLGEEDIKKTEVNSNSNAFKSEKNNALNGTEKSLAKKTNLFNLAIFVSILSGIAAFGYYYYLKRRLR